MSQCHALTKDKSLCRNFGEVLEENQNTIIYSGFCHIHRFPKVKPKEFYRLVKNMEWSNSRCTHIPYLLQEELFEVTKEDVSKLTHENNYTYFILLCSRYVKGFHRDWNPSIFDNAVRYLWKWHNAIGPVEIKLEDFHTLTSVSSWSIIAKLCPYNDQRWSKWLWKYFETEEGMPHLFDISFEKAKGEVEQWLETKQIPTVETFHKMMNLSKKVARAKCRVRMNKIRKDLMETTWHPARVVDWCFDEEDKEFLGFF
jgi:hypothetical protein